MTDLERLATLRFEANGHPRLVPCMRATIYLDRSDAAEIVEYCDAAIAMLRPRLTQYATGSMKRPAKLNDTAFTTVASWFRRPRDYHTYWAQYSDAREGAAEASLRVVINYRAAKQLSPAEVEAEREWRRRQFEERHATRFPAVSEITLTVPLDLPQAAPQAMCDWLLARKLVAATSFASGHCGWGLNYDSTIADMALHRELEGHLAYAATRHPGLDWQCNGVLNLLNRYEPRTRDLIPLIKRVNWLTLLSDRALDALGDGRETVARLAAGPAIAVHRVQHGALVQAGPQPGLGDISRGEDLPAYRYVAGIVRQVRVPAIPRPGVGFPDDMVMQWLESFDKAPP